jgi:nitrogen fixation NifU-like protein
VGGKKMNLENIYSKEVLKHFKSPHNMGELKDPDGIGKVGNPVCGDVMYVYIKVGKNKKGEEIIKDIKVKTFGCIAAIATSSLTTDLAKGRTLKQAMKIGRDEVSKGLGGLPKHKEHCSNLAVDALRKAIQDYFGRKGKNA